jgi:molecular chaperone HscB
MHLEKLNHFEKFNLEAKFLINEDELEARYLKLQQQFHPDISKNETEDEINSILLNEAYKILKNPISRAIYLLQINGFNIADEENAIRPSQEVLILIMEIREEILENKNDNQKISEIKKNVKHMIVGEMKIISDLLVDKKFSEATQKLIKVRYLDKIIVDLKTL